MLVDRRIGVAPGVLLVDRPLVTGVPAAGPLVDRGALVVATGLALGLATVALAVAALRRAVLLLGGARSGLRFGEIRCDVHRGHRARRHGDDCEHGQHQGAKPHRAPLSVEGPRRYAPLCCGPDAVELGVCWAD